MNPLTAGDFNASKKHVLTWYTDFSKGLEIVTHYRQAAEAFVDGRPHGMPNGNITMDFFLHYMKSVFTKTFKKDKSALAEINRVVSLLEKEGAMNNQGAVVLTPQKILLMVKEMPSLQTDFVTWMITLALAHIQSLGEESEAEMVATSVQDGGVCPACGIKAHYGTLRGEEGYRDLACWHCGFVWTVERLKCPYCGEKEQNKMGFFETKEFKGCRIHYCQQCKSYVKVFDFRQVAGFKPVLVLYHLATLVMDDLAVEEGFQPGSELCWSSVLEPKTVDGHS